MLNPQSTSRISVSPSMRRTSWTLYSNIRIGTWRAAPEQEKAPSLTLCKLRDGARDEHTGLLQPVNAAVSYLFGPQLTCVEFFGCEAGQFIYPIFNVERLRARPLCFPCTLKINVQFVSHTHPPKTVGH